ncbi:MAG TPA: hypothetical protein VHS05_00555 [Pyrinomonadaceae bacterium]|jgi:hypothetical protein|nr:hypothetical protein [Pyrinomonadaceae bacterium]
MKNKFWILLVCIQAFGLTALAQNPAKRQLVLPLANGGFVAFRSEMPGNNTTSSLAALLYAQAFAGENRIIHRVLTDAQLNVVFGYDLWVNADPITKKFSVAVLPADEAFRRSFLKDFTPPRSNNAFATFPKSTTPQTLDDGDAVSLELLVNHESGAKIVDVVSVTFDRTTLRENRLESAPKDFTLEAVALGVRNYTLMVNDIEVSKSKSSIGFSGALLWLYIPERGRFIFSLVPREGYDFEKIAVLDENKITFKMDGERYEWVSGTSILPNGGTWNLWVLRDPNYTPLFGAEESQPRSAPKSPNIFERLQGVLNKQGATLTIILPGGGRPKTSVVGTQRVMVGSADSMENLLPKSP